MNYKYTKKELIRLYRDLERFLESLDKGIILGSALRLKSYHHNLAITRGIMDLFFLNNKQSRNILKVLTRANISPGLKRDIKYEKELGGPEFIYNRMHINNKCSIVTGAKKYSKLRINKIRDFMYRMPLDEMPLHISDQDPFSVIAVWRLQLNK